MHMKGLWDRDKDAGKTMTIINQLMWGNKGTNKNPTPSATYSAPEKPENRISYFPVLMVRKNI